MISCGIYLRAISPWVAKLLHLMSLKVIQSSAVITRSNIARNSMNTYKDWSRIPIRWWIHKRHPIPRPSGRAMGCLLWNIGEKIDRVITALHCTFKIITLLIFSSSRPASRGAWGAGGGDGTWNNQNWTAILHQNKQIPYILSPLTLYLLNFSEGTKTYNYILSHSSTFTRHR